jgi:hypothetical protein
MENDLSDELEYLRNEFIFQIQEALIHLERLERGQIKVIGLDPNLPQSDAVLATGEYIEHFNAHISVMQSALAQIARLKR